MCSPLYLGINSLSQLLLGLQLGLWIGIFMKEILDSDRHLSRHFQKIIRGYEMKEVKIAKLILIISAALSIATYYLSNLIAKKVISD